ncbi:MAG TPA: ATP-binding protein [Symbiobacteriaceae bacterium]|nr:ATP-binding protein [Symbiobacteriaceae bacterium]
MNRRGWPLAPQLALSFTLIVAVALGGGGTFLLQRVWQRAMVTRTEDVLAKARAAALLVTETRFSRPGATLTSDLFTFQQQTGVRPLIIGPDGTVTADSWSPSPFLGKPLQLPEIDAALKGREATGTRRLQGEGLTLYAAVPVVRNQTAAGAVLLSANLSDLERSLAELRRLMLWVLAVAGLVTTLLGIMLARWLSSPLQRLYKAASALAQGRLAGIAAEHLPHLFERFYRVDKSRSRATGGVGLGLTIAHQAVSQLGGGIVVESHPGSGTTFTIVLPEAG